MKKIFIISIFIMAVAFYFPEALFAAPNDDLIKACVKGDVAGATAAIESGADVNVKDKNGFTPLHIASNFGKIGIVKLLVEKGADVNIQSANGDTALAIAGAKGYQEVVDFLKSTSAKPAAQAGPAGKPQKALPAKKMAELNEKLLDAALKGDLDRVKAAVAEGADINARNAAGATVLMLAIKQNIRDMFKFAMDCKAEITLKDNSGAGALTYAFEKDDVLFRDTLIAAGAAFDSSPENVRALFVRAVKNCSNPMIRFLLEKGAKPGSIDVDGVPPLIYCIEKGDFEIIRPLAEKGADVNAKDKNGKTVLMYAAELAPAEVFEFLRSKGADVNAKDARGNTIAYYSSLKKTKAANESANAKDEPVRPKKTRASSEVEIAGPKKPDASPGMKQPDPAEAAEVVDLFQYVTVNNDLWENVMAVDVKISRQLEVMEKAIDDVSAAQAVLERIKELQNERTVLLEKLVSKFIQNYPQYEKTFTREEYMKMITAIYENSKR